MLLFPSFPRAGVKHATTILRLDFPLYNSIFNTMPVAVTTIPMGLDSKGLPMGLQIVTSQYNDQNSLAVAQELARRFGGWVPPCQIAF